MRRTLGVIALVHSFLPGLLCAQANPAAGAQARQLFKEGFELLQAGQLPAAAAKFEQGLKGDPGNATAQFHLAETCLGQNDTARAKAAYRRALQLKLSGELAAKANERLAALDAPSNQAAKPAAPAAAPMAAAGKEFRDCETCPLMVVVPVGQFVMGSPPSETGRSDAEGPPHVINIARPFAVGKFEVTFDEWNACVAERACREAKDEGWGQGKRPVINVSHEQATGYVEWLADKTKKPYRLLTEAEWEYAARGGSDKARFWGTSPDRACEFANVDDAAFGCNDGYKNTAPVGSFKPNPFGLHDMLGNVWEWVQDCWNANYEGAPTDGSAWMRGDCSRRVGRGGDWNGYFANVRSAGRIRNGPAFRYNYLGFRVARPLP